MILVRASVSSAVILGVILIALPVRAQDAAQSTLIEGLVTRTTNGTPVEGVTVTAVSDAGAKHSTTTDSTGTFSLKGIPAGHYSLSASRSGFLPYDSEHHSTGVSVSAGQQLKELRISLTPTGVIAGRVLDSNHQPIAGAVVMAIRPSYFNGRQVLVPDLAYTGSFFPIGAKLLPTWEYPKAVTDDRGQYRIFGLAPGAYYVSVWSAGAETLDEATGGINKVPGYTKDQPPIFYPGVVDPDDSIPVSVNGTEQEGIDLELRSQTLHRMRFQVVSSAPPRPCRGIGDAQEAIVLIRHTQKLDVIQYSSRFGNTVFKKGEDNQWTSPLLPAGSYEIFFNPCMFIEARVVGSLTATIVDRDVDAGKLVLPLNTSISGHMQKTEAPAVMLDKVQVRLRPLDLRVASTTMLSNQTRGRRPSIGEDGTFSFDFTSDAETLATVPPGLYQIDIAGLPEDTYVASVKLGGREVRDTGFRVDTDSHGSLEISLSQPGGIVNGEVRDRSGKPVADSFVALVPFNRVLVYSNLFRETRTGQDGTFSIRGLPPGEYGVIALNKLDYGESRTAAFRDEYQSRIRKIIIEPGSLETVSLAEPSR